MPTTLHCPPHLLRRSIEFYLDLHRHPELSGAEARTAARFAERLAGAGLQVATGVGGHGVVGLLRNGPGPVVLLRAELDALPVAERTGLPYASTATAPGPDGRPVPVMHACGHDIHLACAAGAAELLAEAADRWRGTVMVVGQPDEENLRGARAMLADGLYQRFAEPSAVLAQHTAPLPAGMVAHCHGGGVMTAGSLTLDIAIHGRGGHAATPHLAVDPVVAAAAIVLRLQTIVSRETSPAEQVVVTVGALQAGIRANVIPDRASLQVAVRGYSEAAVDRAACAVRRIVEAECAASGCPEEPVIETAVRSPVNAPDPVLAATVRQAHESAFGAARVAGWPGSAAAEDFALYGPAGVNVHGAAGVRTAYWMLGMVGPDQWAAAPGTSAADKLASLPPNHSPAFAPSPRLTLETGITAMAAAALGQLAAASPTEG